MKDYQLVLRVSMRCADDAQARARAKTVLGAATLGSFAQSVKLQRLEPKASMSLAGPWGPCSQHSEHSSRRRTRYEWI